MKLLEKNKSRIAITIDMWISSNQSKRYMTSYLRRTKKEIIENFDILWWCKQSGLKLPTLKNIGREFLANLISTVALETAFSTSDHVITSERNRLKENTLETLI